VRGRGEAVTGSRWSHRRRRLRPGGQDPHELRPCGQTPLPPTKGDEADCDALMPTPVAHAIAAPASPSSPRGGCPRARTPVAAAILLRRTSRPRLPCRAGRREAMERLHQGRSTPSGSSPRPHCTGLGLAPEVGLRRACCCWRAPASRTSCSTWRCSTASPGRFPFFWPFSAERLHSPISVFPGIDRVNILGMRNLRELLVELAWASLRCSSRCGRAGPAWDTMEGFNARKVAPNLAFQRLFNCTLLDIK